MTIPRSFSSAAAACALLFLPGCVHGADAGPDPAAVRQAIEAAAAQVQRCYRAPRVPYSARQIVTRLRVRLTPEGRLVGVPALVGQESVTPSNRAYAGAMAEAAAAAVLRCTPFRLPAGIHAGGWDDFDLTFSPRGIA